MSTNWVDIALLVGLLVVAIAGWRSGVITTAASFAGFIGGALCGAWLVPHLLDGREWPAFLQAMATLAGMFVLGVIGQSILGFAGRTVRDAVDFRPIRVVDSASGMVVSVLAFLLCAWMVLSVAASSSLGPTSEQVRASRGFPLLDEVLAGPGGALLDDARELLATIDVPSLPFNPATLPPVEDPSNVEISEGGRAGGPGLGGPGVDHLDPLRLLVAGLGGRGQPRSGGHERPRRGRCRSDHRRIRERPGDSRGTAGLPRPGRTTSRSCTSPASSRRCRSGSPTHRGGPTPWWPDTRVGGR